MQVVLRARPPRAAEPAHRAIPARPVARALSDGLQRPGDAGTPSTVTVRVLPGADHRLALPPDAKQPGVETMAQDVFPALETWLRGLGP